MKLKLRKSFNGNLKAVSPVIATIIIVAIAITMSIAVAYWLLGLGSSFTKFEKVEFINAYPDGNNIFVMNVKNTGTASATIDPNLILYNGKPGTATGYEATAVATIGTSQTGTVAADGSLVLDPGQTGTITTTLTGTGWTSGMTVEIMLHSNGGKDYPKVVTMP